MRILNFGSLNIDHVYAVEHIARPGETLTSSTYQVFAGGKGANQSAALGRAGAPVYHAGLVGSDGAWLIDKLTSSGVDMRFTEEAEDGVTGHAVIQVEENGGQNSIVLYPGCNHAISQARIKDVIEEFGEGDILLLQNEISEIPYLIEQGSTRGMSVCFNPAPMTPAVLDYPLDQVDLLIVNQTEAAALGASVEAPRERRAELRPTGGEGRSPSPPLRRMSHRQESSTDKRRPTPAHHSPLDQCHRPAPVLLTLGEKGAIYRGDGAEHTVEAAPATVVDTTGAGDTFIGYFIACVAQGLPAAKALRRAAAAAALSVSRAGAMDSIPLLDEVIRHEHYQESVT